MRWIAAGALVTAGCALIAFASAWRGLETIASARAVHVITGQETVANSSRHLLVLYDGGSVQSTFVLTSECSIAYVLAALLIVAAPLMLLRQLSPWRTTLAVGIAAAILIIGNVARLAAIGATVSGLGLHPGLTIAHTYLGSLLTVLGTGTAGVAFAWVLTRGRSDVVAGPAEA